VAGVEHLVGRPRLLANLDIIFQAARDLNSDQVAPGRITILCQTVYSNVDLLGEWHSALVEDTDIVARKPSEIINVVAREERVAVVVPH
jgi:hypothetical protein